MIFTALSSMWLAFEILHEVSRLIHIFGVDVGGQGLQLFAQVYIWVLPFVAVASFAYFFMQSKGIRITPNSIEIYALPFSRRPTIYRSHHVVGVFCFPYRLQMGPLRPVSRLYEMVQLVMADGTRVCLGYSTIPGDAYQYAQVCARRLETELKTFSPESIHNQQTHFYSSMPRAAASTNLDNKTSAPPASIASTANGSTIQFQVKEIGKPPAQAIIVASLPMGLALLWHGSGGPWWGTAFMSSIGIAVLAWHLFYKPSFNTDAIHFTSKELIFLSRGHIEVKIPIEEIDTIYLSEPGYRIPQALVVASKQGTHYLSGGLTITELLWLGREVGNQVLKAARYRPRPQHVTSTSPET